jgi:hypothetical protein
MLILFSFFDKQITIKYMEIEDITNQAEKERRRQINTKKKDIQIPKIVEKKAITPESWKIYKEISPVRFNMFFWIFIVLTFFVCFGIYFVEKNKLVLYCSICTGTLFLFRISLHCLGLVVGFQKYKNWRKTLSYKLNGWESISKFKNFPEYEFWDIDVEVHVIPKEGHNPEAKKALSDALFLFITNANKCHYELNFSQEGFSGDIRKKWKTNGNLGASGSANSSVLKYLYIALNKYFRIINDKWDAIDEINVDFSGNIRKVKPVEVSID